MSTVSLEILRAELQVIKNEILHALTGRSDPEVLFPGADEFLLSTEWSADSRSGVDSSNYKFKEPCSAPDTPFKLDGNANYELLERQEPLTDFDPQVRTQARQRVESRFSQFVESNAFNHFVSLAILANVTCFVCEVDYLARSWSQEVTPFFRLAEVVFLIVFTAEITIRICAFRLNFFVGKGALQNWYDFVLVTLQILEEILKFFSSIEAQARTVFGAMRVLRISRILRVMRLVHLLPELQALVRSIGSCLKQLTWVALLLVMATGAFGVVLTQIVTDHKTALGRERMEHEEILEEYFGSVTLAMLRLYMTISDGMHWAEMADPLMEMCSPWTSLIFVAYSAFVTMAMMNVVTAFFVETALRVAQDDSLNDMSLQLWELFGCDKSHDNHVTEKDFFDHLGTRTLCEYFNRLDLTTEQAEDYHFFQLLDSDGSGFIDRRELKNGCIRLLGSARAVDLALLNFEHKQETKKQADHRQHVQNALISFDRKLGRMAGNKLAL